MEFCSHIAELSVRFARFAGGSAILLLLLVDFGTFGDFDCCGGGVNEVAWLALGFFDGKPGDGIGLDNVSKLLERNLSLTMIDDCEADMAS